MLDILKGPGIEACGGAPNYAGMAGAARPILLTGDEELRGRLGCMAALPEEPGWVWKAEARRRLGAKRRLRRSEAPASLNQISALAIFIGLLYDLCKKAERSLL